jgi:hypothetical protein
LRDDIVWLEILTEVRISELGMKTVYPPTKIIFGGFVGGYNPQVEDALSNGTILV